MRRKAVSHFLGAAAEARASLLAHRPRLVPQLDGRLPPGEAAFSYDGYFDHMDFELAQVQDRLTAAEDEHVKVLAKIIDLRRERDRRSRGIYDKQAAARQVLAGYHGQDRGFEMAAVSGPTPQLSKPLSEQVDQTTKMLRDPAVQPSPGRIKGVEIDPEEMAVDLETDLALLQAVREAYERTRKEADGTRQVVNARLAEFKEVFPWVASTAEGFFRLVGERELADRIRSSRRKVTRKQGEEAGADEAPAEDSPPDEVSEEAEAAEAAEAAESQ